MKMGKKKKKKKKKKKHGLIAVYHFAKLCDEVVPHASVLTVKCALREDNLRKWRAAKRPKPEQEPERLRLA
jgi:hypothetical protein